jgi:GNAT superfamily N-acetyltransferase
MECVVCGESVTDKDALSLLIGWACEKCVPRGARVPFQVRRAEGLADREFVSRHLDELFGETEFIEFGRWYRVDEMEQLVAVTGQGTHIGLAVYALESGEPSLMTLLTINVHRSYLRRGVASALLDKVVAIATEAGVSRIRVPISNDDLLSYVFYHQRGFRLSGIDVELCVQRHGSELEGFWRLPVRDEFYLFRDLKGGQDGH